MKGIGTTDEVFRFKVGAHFSKVHIFCAHFWAPACRACSDINRR